MVVACLTIWLTLRKQARQPAIELLAGTIQNPKPKTKSRGAWLALGAASAALAIVIWAFSSGERANAEAFFSAGALLLIAGLAAAAAWLTLLARRTSVAQLSLGQLAVRGCSRRKRRSL